MKDNSRVTSPVDAENAYARSRAATQLGSLLLVFVVGWELGIMLLKASRTSFWYDELVTFYVSTLHPFSLLWKALQEGADGMTPAYYAIVQLARLLPGNPHITLRLPSILGYVLTLLGCYWFARRRLPSHISLLAVLLVSLSPFRWYALDARSYSLLVGFLAISAVLWQRSEEKWLMTPLLAVSLSLAVSVHYLGVVAIAAFAVAELTWTFLSRRIRGGVWAACLLATGPFLVSVPILLNFRDLYAKNFWSRPRWIDVISTYGGYFGLDVKFALVLIVLLGLVIGASLLHMGRNLRDQPREHDFGLPEIVLLGAFTFYPAFLVVLTKLLNSGYTARYGWPAVFGAALGSIYLLRYARAALPYLLSALVIAFAYQGFRDFDDVPKPGSTVVEERWVRLEARCQDKPRIPVVIGSPTRYLVAFQYSPSSLRDRLVEVVDADSATRLVGVDTGDKENRLLARFIPLRVEDLAPFEAAHPNFILLSGGSFDWFTQYLLEKRYHLRLISRDGDDVLYEVER